MPLAPSTILRDRDAHQEAGIENQRTPLINQFHCFLLTTVMKREYLDRVGGDRPRLAP
jgi:hypothetical protein